MNRTRRHLTLLLLGASALTGLACGILEPDADQIPPGRYILRSVDGLPLPVGLNSGPSVSATLLGDTLWLYRDGSYMQRYTIAMYMSGAGTFLHHGYVTGRGRDGRDGVTLMSDTFELTTIRRRPSTGATVEIEGRYWDLLRVWRLDSAIMP